MLLNPTPTLQIALLRSVAVAVAPGLHRQGFGQLLLGGLPQEARRRDVATLLAEGTSRTRRAGGASGVSLRRTAAKTPGLVPASLTPDQYR